MIIPTTLFFAALGYLFYISKKELPLEEDTHIKSLKENDDLHEDLEDLFI